MVDFYKIFMHEQEPNFGIEEKNIVYWFLIKAKPF